MIRARWNAMPKLIRFLLIHFADGVAIGWTAALVVIHADVMGMGTLLDAHGLLAEGLFFAQAGLLFGTGNASVAIMNLGDD